MIREVPMNDRQAALIGAAFVVSERAKRELDLLLEGIASGLEGKLVDADTDKKIFRVEIPDESESNELA